ncbi:unnamed protein product [Ixodes hexagonus]
MHVLEMAPLDGLTYAAAQKKESECGTSSRPSPGISGSTSSGSAPAEVSSRALYSVFAVLGAFLVVSVVGAAVTFVETQAKERNMTSPSVEFLQFVNVSLPASLHKDDQLRGNVSFVNILDAIKAVRMARMVEAVEATTRSVRYGVLREH